MSIELLPCSNDGCSVRTKAREIEKANAKLEHQLQRAPTDEEMANELKVTPEEFHDALLQISNSTVAALDELWTVSDSSGDQVSLLDTLTDENAPDPAAMIDQTDLKERVAEDIRDGDIFATNDPFYGGVTHLNDVVLAM